MTRQYLPPAQSHPIDRASLDARIETGKTNAAAARETEK